VTRELLLHASLAIALAALAAAAPAQEKYPTCALRAVVPFSPGGGVDIIA
jgi:tripartite-type tricarboxylate transporter receptor subunit TctC